MSDNKKIRNKMIILFGRVCMLEASGIRYIPLEDRKSIKGYKKFEDTITYHHIKEKQRGGKRTIVNGALIKEYNHNWLHSLSNEEKEEINRKIQEFKLNFISKKLGDVSLNEKDRKTLEDIKLNIMIVNGNLEIEQSFSLNPDFSDCITIPVYNTKKKQLDKRRSIKEKEDRKQRKYRTKYFDEDDWREM